MSFISRIWQRSVDMIAPKVCDHCEGGSGFTKRPGSDELQVCEACHGTGKRNATARMAESNHRRR